MQRKAGGGGAQPCDSTVVAYYFCGEPIPYRTLVRGRAVTLGQFKELLTKKGNYRYVPTGSAVRCWTCL